MGGDAPRGATGAVTVIGLGPAGPGYLTDDARRALASVRRLYLRTARHPAAEALRNDAVALDGHYEDAETFADAYRGIVDEVTEGALALGHVGYAVPGSPFVLEATVEMLRADSRLAIGFVEGMSFLDLAWSRLGIDPIKTCVRLIDGERFAIYAARERGPLLVAQVWSKRTLADIKLDVPDQKASVLVLSHLGLEDESIVEIEVGELDRVDPDHLVCLFIPELGQPVGQELARLEQVVTELRARCPWDAAQTHHSLVRHLIEECYEAVEAIELLGEPPDPDKAAALEEELGDVLCQVMFHAVMASEEGLFSLGDVATTVHDKLVHRHPHVYGGQERKMSVDAVLSQWEELKRQEKGRKSVMDGIPKGLPALVLSSKLERKANGAGLGWDKTGITERDLGEPVDGSDAEAVGRLLFSIGRLAAHRGVDPEEATRRAAARFRERFELAERLAAEKGSSIAELEERQRLELWAAASPSPI